MTRRLCHLACLVAVLTCGNNVLVGQQAPGNLADANNPSGPPGPMQSPSIWSVDPLTGALTLKVPVTTPLAGGRGPHYGTTLLYNSSSTLTLQFQGINQSNNYAMYSWIGADQSPSSFAPHGPWIWSGPIIQTNSQTIDDIPIYGTGSYSQTIVGGFIGCTITGPALYEDAGGGTHDLNVVYVQMNTNGSQYNNYYDWSPNPGCDYTNTLAGQSKDGSAIQSVLYNNTIPTAIEPDGTSVSAGTLEDSNGNVNSGQDAEGRIQLSGSGNCQFAGDINITPTTCSFTAYDPNGAAIHYTVSAQTIAIGSLSMPHPVGSEMTNPYMAGTPGSTVSGIQFITSETNTITGVKSVTYPDTTSFQFGYAPVSECTNNPVYGTVTSITFPTGGYVDFCWEIRNSGEYSSTVSAQSTFAVTDVYLFSELGSSASHWHYSYADVESGGTASTTETAPDGTVTVYTGGFAAAYSTIFNRGAMVTFQETSRDITGNTGHLRTIATSYEPYGNNGWGQPYQVTTTYWDVSPAQKQTVQYSYDAWGNVTEKDESAFYTSGSIPWLRKTLTTYAYSQPYCPQTVPSHTCPSGTASNFQTNYPNDTPPNIHLVNKPSQVEITDGYGNVYSIVQYGYDETPICFNTQPCLASGALNHDDGQYGSSRQAGRGNLTSEARCALPTPIANGNCTYWLLTTYVYDSTGQRVKTTDPNGNVTQFSFQDTFSAGAPGSEGTSFTYGTTSSPTDSFLTKATYATGAYDTYEYDYFQGERTKHVGWNPGPVGTPPTTYSFDYMQRPLSVGYPDGGGFTYCYTDEGGSSCNAGSPPFTAFSSILASPSPTRNSNVQYDGLGRPTKSTAANGAEIDTTYDLMGRVASVSNPYFSGSGPIAWTTYAYDGLGRVRYKCDQDNGTGSGVCVPGSSYKEWSYAGPMVTFYDENRNSWQRTSDGLGQLTSVVEPNGANTFYVFDPLGNLTCAAQDGGSGGSYSCNAAQPPWRRRTFTYDSASRLITAANPETGTVCYGTWNGQTCSGGYDGNSNLIAKTDARGVVTWFSYDALNRLLSKTYSNAPAGALSSCYQYDSAPNGNGHLGAEWTQAGACPSSPPGSNVYQTLRKIGAYDLMGRVESEQQCVSGYCTSVDVPPVPASNCLSLSGTGGLQYCYDEAGNLLAFSGGATTASVGTYPQAAMTFSQTFNAAGQLYTLGSSWNDGTHPQNLFTGQQYSASDVLSNWLLGAHLSVLRSFDNRLRVTGQTGTRQ